MNGRKVVQITTHKGAFYDTALAVCDDGTMWSSLLGAGPPEWKQLPPIPQDAVPEPAAVRPGPVTAAEVSRATAANSALQDIGHTTCSAMESVLHDFLDRRGISADPADSNEQAEIRRLRDELQRSMDAARGASLGRDDAYASRDQAIGLRDEALRRRREVEVERDKLREVKEAFRYYVDASDRELEEAGISRDDALTRARELDDAIAAAGARS